MRAFFILVVNRSCIKTDAFGTFWNFACCVCTLERSSSLCAGGGGEENVGQEALHLSHLHLVQDLRGFANRRGDGQVEGLQGGVVLTNGLRTAHK